MNRCPITYETCGNNKYAAAGLKKLARGLNDLKDFPYTSEEQRREAVTRAAKMSIQGVQPKVSARLNIKNECFEIVDTDGRFILKPQSLYFPELPENEDLTMRLAEISGIEVPFHGLICCRDGSHTYFIRRFDRIARKGKLAVEDFAQLAGKTRDTKYDYSMEKLVALVDSYCTFPAVEKVKLFRIVLFNFLTGNEDMHLKNYSLISKDGKTELSPAYDLINTTIALKEAKEEIALTLDGKRSGLTWKIMVEYFGAERLNVPRPVIQRVLDEIIACFEKWESLINDSFLSNEFKEKYYALINNRKRRLFI